MTIVNTSSGFIFIHVPKAAGTSVKAFLGDFTRYCDVEVGGSSPLARDIVQYYRQRFGITKHSRAIEICRAVGAQDFSRLYKFSFVRNPFARTESIFTFLKYKWKTWANSAAMDSFSNVNEFVVSEFFSKRGPDSIFEPQVHWLSDANGQICIDYIGKVETLAADLEHICKTLQLGAPTSKVGKRNSSGKPARDAAPVAFSDAAIEAIQLRYKLDFEILGYSPDPLVLETAPAKIV